MSFRRRSRSLSRNQKEYCSPWLITSRWGASRQRSVDAVNSRAFFFSVTLCVDNKNAREGIYISIIAGVGPFSLARRKNLRQGRSSLLFALAVDAEVGEMLRHLHSPDPARRQFGRPQCSSGQPEGNLGGETFELASQRSISAREIVSWLASGQFVRLKVSSGGDGSGLWSCPRRALPPGAAFW